MKQPAGFSGTKRLAVSAILAGLSFVFLYVGALSGILDLCAVVIGALCTAFAVIEIGGIYPWLLAAVASILSVLLLPDKFVALEYVALGGVYPILKSYFERLPRLLSWICKFIYFNGVLTLAIFASQLFFAGNEDPLPLHLAVYALGNVFFVIFDIALTRLITFYVFRLRKRLKIKSLK